MLLGLVSACITINPVNLGKKSALERQLMGPFEPLSEEELLVASVRSSLITSVGPLVDLQRAALAARRRQVFNQDDKDDLQESGCLGEANDATLAKRPCDSKIPFSLMAQLERIIKEENQDRAAIINWVLASDPILKAESRLEIQSLYRALLRAQLKEGYWYQKDDGAWARWESNAPQH